ncbi:hypothetical protein BBP40_007423 [Aspergillus hancockii]|nr:hypothetical protein BBP40_007423 [Aspergillus hancockii]
MESSSSKSAELRSQAQAKAGEEESLFVQDDEGSATERESWTKVKKEPTDDDQVMVDVAAHADEGLTTDDGLLPVQKVKVRRKISREPPAVKDPKSLLRTKEDIEEYERHEQDLTMVKDLFTKEEKPPAEEPKEPQLERSEQPESSAEDAEPATEGEEKKEAEDEEDESAADKLAGQLFLMQFPPMTPNLVPGGDNPDAVSTEAQGQDGPEVTDTNSGNQPAQPAIKREDGGEIIDRTDESQSTEPSKVVTATDWQLRAGRVGKLNVHASGKMTMDWGGISFELDRATAVDFLQEALIVSGPTDPAEAEAPEDENKVWAMGQLSGKFTVTPDWEKML